MKQNLLLLLLAPMACFAQVKKTKKPVKKQPVVKTVAIKKVEAQKPVDGFLIKGKVAGFPDGTPVNLFNGNNGTPEGSAVLNKGTFSFTGKSAVPDFKVIAFNNAAPYITIFLDNSLVTVEAKKDSFEYAVVKGSPAHDDFAAFSKLAKPYEKIFSGEDASNDSVKNAAAEKLAVFIKQHPQSYITPMAVYRHFQLTENTELMETEFNALPDALKQTPIGSFIAKQIVDSKKNPVGQPLADFSQADTSGTQVTLSSLKGKYVLIDFWASWCRPCRMENPNVVNVYTKFKDKNFTVLGVSLDQAKPAWIDAIKMDNLTWTHVSDLKGWGNAVAQQFEIFSIPQNFLLDPQGNIIAKNLRGPALESKLEKLIK